MQPVLKVRNVHKDFHMHILNDKTIPALEDVNFEVGLGEIIGLTGKSGSGKSSLMKCIHRTYLANSGSMEYLSSNYGTIDLVSASEHMIIRIRREEMTYCSQFLSVIPRVSAVEVVAEALENRGVDLEIAKEKAAKLIERLGLPEELWDAYPSTFSGGEQQRINVARAIISNPRFLLIDEPTASLDQKTKDVVIDLILELREKGTSVILITHDKHTLDRLADREIHLAGGKIQEPSLA
ncbi:MAG: ATP-binding cassette domain-containing protein [Opitutales bacterium]|nr:ATP-binding cassette domain-containing protein [Opitutales bacterium]